MSDLIDRQAAIERIVKIRPSTPKQSDYSQGVDVGMAMAIVAIKEQPSAQPEVLACGSGELVQESDSLVKDCISRQAAIDAIRKDVMGGLNYESILKRLPSAQPELIRCKECKHYNAGFECLIEGYGIERDKDWFCGDAERREEDD